MRLLEAGAKSGGVIVIGVLPTELATIGPLAAGVIPTGCPARGVIAIGRLAPGVFAFGRSSVVGRGPGFRSGLRTTPGRAHPTRGRPLLSSTTRTRR